LNNKGMKLFIKVFYYAFTIVAGIILAIVLPKAISLDLPFDIIEESLQNKDYENSIRLVGGYYDSNIIYQQDTSDIKIIVYASAILEEDDQGTEAAKIKKAYNGFIFNLKNSDQFKLSDNNKPVVRSTGENNKKMDYELINCDVDSDGENESIYTLQNYHFIYFQFKEEDIDSIQKIVLFDNTQTAIFTVDGLNLSFSENFFSDVNDFVNEYNCDYNSPNLNELDEEFRSKSTSYKMSNSDDINQKVNKKSSIIIVIYFLLVYIIGDITVGKRYIVHGIQKIIKKITKKEDAPKEENFGDYYTQVTYSIMVPSDCEASFLVTYSNQTHTIEFPLSKASGYSVTKRVHAGVYMNAWVEVEGYQAIDFPKQIEVRGFTKSFTATFTHKKVENNKLEANLEEK